ncbi:hypothetical protein LCGC14_2889370 [marine sediment metagenome]|uniref:Uncharacterized protein n=1 Tax=marine sediment metagenome TaxID=412755 RepID=A0A0F9ANW4_9ZZZZ
MIKSPIRIPFNTQPCDKLTDCNEPAEFRYEDEAQLCLYHSNERDGTLPPTYAELLACVKAVREQAVYGFTGETLENMRDGMSAREMNSWWMKRLEIILEETRI